MVSLFISIFHQALFFVGKKKAISVYSLQTLYISTVKKRLFLLPLFIVSCLMIKFFNTELHFFTFSLFQLRIFKNYFLIFPHKNFLFLRSWDSILILRFFLYLFK